MNKRPIPTFKVDDELESFINEANVIHDKLRAENEAKLAKINKAETETIGLDKNVQNSYVKKSLVLKSSIDDALRLESAKTKIKQISIMEEAIAEFLRKKGYENI